MPQEILDRIAEFVSDWDCGEPNDKRWLASSGCDLIKLAKTCRLLFQTSIKQICSKGYFAFEDNDDCPRQGKGRSASAIFVKFVQQIGSTNASHISRVLFYGCPPVRKHDI